MFVAFSAHSATLVASYSPLDQHVRRFSSSEEQRAEATRNVSTRIDEIEIRADAFDMRLRQLNARAKDLEQPHRWVLSGFECAMLFFQIMERVSWLLSFKSSVVTRLQPVNH